MGNDKIVRLSDKSRSHLTPEKLLEYAIEDIEDMKDLCLIFRNKTGHLFFGRTSGPTNTEVIGMLEYAKQMIFTELFPEEVQE